LQAEDFEITAGWGHAGKGGVTMPGKGKLIERDYTPIEIEALTKTAERLGLTPEETRETLGATTCDRLSQRFGVLAQRSAQRLGIYHRRLSGDKEMAQLPRKRIIKTPAESRGSQRSPRHSPTHLRDFIIGE